MDIVMRLFTGIRALRLWAIASLVGNILIVVSGAVVRLTDSGLGCPTWPRCTPDAYVPHAALGHRGVIEFGNRLVTFALAIVVIGTLVTAWRLKTNARAHRDLRVLAIILAVSIPIQAVIGGVTVLSGLNPFVVALHLLASLVLICVCVLFIYRVYDLPRVPAGRPGLIAVRATFVLMCVAVWLGTVVTGSGPHSGARGAARTGFDGVVVSHLHAMAVYGVIAGTLACIVLLRSRAAVLLLGVELIQGLIGFVQYFTGLPIALVVLHLLGASLAMASATDLLLSVRRSTMPARVDPTQIMLAQIMPAQVVQPNADHTRDDQNATPELHR